jgi:hypothetical protein
VGYVGYVGYGGYVDRRGEEMKGNIEGRREAIERIRVKSKN